MVGKNKKAIGKTIGRTLQTLVFNGGKKPLGAVVAMEINPPTLATFAASVLSCNMFKQKLFPKFDL